MIHDPCRCGHSWDVHQHYRNHDDCGICGRTRCPRYRRPVAPWRARLVVLAARYGPRRGRDGYYGGSDLR